MKKTIVFDFDGVISTYRSGWKGIDVLPDPPVPGIKELIDKLRENNFEVVIVSTRCIDPDGLKAIKKYLSDNQITVDKVGSQKPPATCYIDDRGICFTGTTEGLFEKIVNFKSWTEQA